MCIFKHLPLHLHTPILQVERLKLRENTRLVRNSLLLDESGELLQPVTASSSPTVRQSGIGGAGGRGVLFQDLYEVFRLLVTTRSTQGALTQPREPGGRGVGGGGGDTGWGGAVGSPTRASQPRCVPSSRCPLHLDLRLPPGSHPTVHSERLDRGRLRLVQQQRPPTGPRGQWGGLRPSPPLGAGVCKSKH